MDENTNNRDRAHEAIESVLISLGGHKDYHAKILAGAILDVLKEEGLIQDTYNPEEKE